MHSHFRIAAEEMGLGKTVEVMALTLANPPPPTVVAGAMAPCGRIVSRGTLVVCAVSLVGQWQAEAASKTAGSCRIHPYHGCARRGGRAGTGLGGEGGRRGSGIVGFAQACVRA